MRISDWSSDVCSSDLDPVEYLIPAAIQNTVVRNLDVAAHDNYAAKLRALKRSAMTDVLLGEIRDIETGKAFMDLAGSGVNVYTTVHAPSAALIPQRDRKSTRLNSSH